MNNEKISKNNFVELKYTGYVQGAVFDSNVEEDLKKISPQDKPQETIIAVGHGMVVSGLDKAIEGKEIGKQYTITLTPKEGFGERKRDLLKTLPLKLFSERRIEPRIGAMFTMDSMLVKIVAVSGARVTADFNNPLAGKEISYTFSIVRKVENAEEQARALIGYFFRFVPDFTIEGEEIIVKGPKPLEVLVQALKKKFEEIMHKNLRFELKEEKKETEHEKEHAHSHEHHDHTHNHEHAPEEHTH